MRPNFQSSSLFAGLFVVFTIVGTVTHELGHVTIAKWFGYETTLHYGSMNWYLGPLDDRLDVILANYDLKVEKEIDSPIIREYDHLMAVKKKHRFWILTGGPIQTMFTGLIGLSFLWIRQAKRPLQKFKWLDWLAVFMALFWLREIFNPVVSMIKHLLGDDTYHSGDEFKLSRLLGLNEWALPVLLGIFSSAIIVLVVFNVVPLQNRASFVVGGVFGSLAGFLVWMKLLGPVVLP